MKTRRLFERRMSSRLFALLAFVAALSFASAPRVVKAHEPITTRVRFNKEVIRILQANCLSCHRSGGIAMSLENYDDARPWAKAIKEELLRKRMPPWPAVKGYGQFSNAPLLSQRDIDLIVNWVEGGAPKGDDKDLPPQRPSQEWPLGEPDAVLKLPVEAKISADADEYQSFALDPGFKEDRWLSAVDLSPGNATVVRCATISIEPSRSGVDLMTGERQAASSKTCVATWFPGQRALPLNDPFGFLVPAGSRIVVRIHYKGNSETVSDRSEVGLYFSKSAMHKQVRQLSFNDPGAVIPAGASRHRIKLATVLEQDLDAVAIRPRVNPLILSIQATAYRPDGSQEVLLWSRGYQFEWEMTYFFKQPLPLPKGTRVEVIAYFDNSNNNRSNPYDPVKQLRWSDLSADSLLELLTAAN